jgi:hypothetical protein
MNRKLFLSFVFIYLLVTTSCTPIFYGITGIRNPKVLSDQEVTKVATKWGIPNDASFVLDTGLYKRVLRKAITDESRNNHAQPLQALYFIGTNYPSSYQINCYAGGFPNLNWNRNGNMNVFPPHPQAPIDSLLTFEDIVKCIRPIGSNTQPINGQRPVIVVFWTKFMHRQSKRFLKVVKENAALSNQLPVSVVYVNADNLFANE